MTDDKIETANTTATEPNASLNRRILVGGTVAAGLATAGYLRLAGAQTESSTPEAEVTDDTSATPDASTSTGDTSRTASMLDHAETVLAAVRADRDAVASEFDTTTVDAVFDQATQLVEAAQAALDGGDTQGAVRFAAGAWQSAEAAGDLIVAQLSYPGLPSQEGAASRVLARAFERIGDVTATADTADADVSFYVTTAQGVYQTAYDQYNDGAYAQALANGKAIVALTGAAAILSGDEGLRLPGTFDDGHFGRGRLDVGMQLPMDVFPMPDMEAWPDEDEPETVPAPDF